MSDEIKSLPQGSKVLVTGATGFTGSHLVKKLCKMDIDVHAIARPSSDRSQFKDLNITWHIGNVYDEDIIKKATKGVDYIFHVAALFRQSKDDDSEYEKVHVTSTKLLAEAALQCTNFKRFVHVSTMGVHGHIPNPPGNEESPYAPGDVYQDTKLEAELWVREFSKEKNLPLSVIRPTGIYGPGDKRLLKVFKMAKWKFCPILGSGKCLYHLVHVDDLTDAIILAASHPHALGDYFLVGSEQHISLEEMLDVIGNKIKHHTKVVRIPVTPFFLLADILEFVCKPFGIQPPIYRRRVAFYTKDRSFSVKKIAERLGFKPKYTNQKGLEETAEWYLKEGLL